MGSWSVYCGISNITINYGTPCVLLPLKINTAGEYHEYAPATPPIFGTYNDYGGIERIEETEATKLMEKHFNCTIDQFAHFFTRRDISTSEEDFPKFLMEVDEVSNWKYMFIHREVYDFMIQAPYDSWRGISFGDSNMLKYLDFKLVETVDGIETWEKDGKLFNTRKGFDSLTVPNTNDNIHYLNKGNPDSEEMCWHKKSSLCTYVSLEPEKIAWLSNKNRAQIWPIMNKKYFMEEVAYIIGRSRHFYDPTEMISDMLEGFHSELEDENITEEERTATKSLIEKYEQRLAILTDDNDTPENTKTFLDRVLSNYKVYGDDLANLVRVQQVMHAMSGTWSPYIYYLTPQCGDYSNHSALLKKFIEINDKYVEDEEEEY